MASDKCDICFSTYDSDRFIPKVLSCGYTLCSYCLDILRDELPSMCIHCRKPFLEIELENTPKNFTLLDEPEEEDNESGSPQKITSKEFRKDLDSFKKQFINVVDQVTQKMNTISSKLGPHDQDLRETEKLIFGRLNSSLNIYHNLTSDFLQTDFQPTFSLRRFGNKNLFFYKISLHASNEESIYVGHLVEGKVKYGKITCDDKHVFFHALTLSKIDKGATVVSLLDVKEYVKAIKFSYFIEFIASKLIVNIEDHLLGINLIDRFTGETGCCLKDALLRVNNLPDTEIFINGECERYRLNSFEKEHKKLSSKKVSHARRAESLGSGSNSSEPAHENISSKEIVLTMISSKRFLNLKKRNIYNRIVGKLEDISSIDFTVLVRNRQIGSNVLDCGLALPY